MALHKSRNNFWKSHERLKEDKNKTLNSISYFTVVKGIYIKVEITFEYHLRLKADKNKNLTFNFLFYSCKKDLQKSGNNFWKSL
jgi:hypothetical protein